MNEEMPAERVYRVHYIEKSSYYDDNNYPRPSEEYDLEEYLEADSVEELYEKMAKCLIDWKIKGEERYETSRGYLVKDSFDVEFSPIYIYVDDFSKEKLKATKTYQEIGSAREIAKKRQEEQEKVEALRRAENTRLAKEKEEKETYDRLRKKFKNQ